MRARARLAVRPRSAPEPVVVDEKLAANGDQVAKEVDQRVALHDRIMTAQGYR